MSQKQDYSRREILKSAGFLSAALLFAPKISLAKNDLSKKQFLIKKSISPIQEVTEFQSTDFNGDNIDRPHDILWNTDGYIAKKGGIPNPTEKRKLVIVGGGMAGLLAAYRFKDLNPLVLEQDKCFGGNSKGEKLNQDAIYSIGAAYVTIPDEDSSIDQFFKETGLDQELKLESDKETHFVFKTKLMRDFWQGSTDPKNADQFIKVEHELRRIYNDAYPDIPWSPESQISKSEYDRLDSMSFKTWLDETFGDVHPHILEYFQKYCWSSFTGSIDELSALQVLNFVASEVDGVLALPGGNARICEVIMNKLDQVLTPQSLRAGAFTLEIKIQKNNELWVTYEDELGKFITIETEKVIFCAPKFVAQRIIKDLPEEQNKIMDQLLYRGYIVTNVILDGQIPAPGFDLYWFQGQMPEAPSAMKPPSNYTTDVCFGTWAQGNDVKNTVLTMYRPLAFDGARQFLFSPFAHQKNKMRSEVELEQFMKSLGLSMEQVKGMRLTRWGHSLPVADVGLLASGKLDVMNRPIKNKIFFANQDNYANPAFECAFAAVLECAKNILN